jgi:hypothetical protein
VAITTAIQQIAVDNVANDQRPASVNAINQRDCACLYYNEEDIFDPLVP